MPKATYFADAMLGLALRDATFTKLTTVYVALFTADPTAAGLLTNELAIGVGGYTRAAVAVADLQWSAPATSGGYRAMMNENIIDFGTASAGLGTVTHFAIMDAATAGNMLWYGALGTPRTIGNTDTIQVPAGSMIVREG